ncbi:unnamed protein product [Microthlaspi erraticum]|uniref:Potassium channel n=1 Tax=Microthlaspi erraticum TaxID=1685480 RepID=A0A6D2KKT4_9BRAS|nr:unnamed protein product [Microthlaspi erraticum]
MYRIKSWKKKSWRKKKTGEDESICKKKTAARIRASGRHELVRYILWIRLFRVRKVTGFFHRLEKDTRVNYLFTRILKLVFVEVYCTHTAACIFYYLATSLPPEKEGYTWIGSLKLGDYSYENFRQIDLWKRYITSLYFAIVTMATVDCSSEFINQIVIRLHEEYFLPGEVITEQGNVVDNLYFVCEGLLEAIVTRTDGTEESVTFLGPHASFGDISIMCNISQPFTVRVCDLCHLLRLDKQSFSNILEIYFQDGRKILNNLMEGKQTNERVKKLESDLMIHIGKQEAELALKLNSAAFQGDIYHLKSLIRAGADPNKQITMEDDHFMDPNSEDYDHRKPLHIAASEGLYLMAKMLVEAGASVIARDRWGNSPLDEARMCGNKKLIKLLEDAKTAK